jgi:hypothetical protein
VYDLDRFGGVMAQHIKVGTDAVHNRSLAILGGQVFNGKDLVTELSKNELIDHSKSALAFLFVVLFLCYGRSRLCGSF